MPENRLPIGFGGTSKGDPQGDKYFNVCIDRGGGNDYIVSIN
jgi:hypothetical protein